ncbi:GtrA family protein [Spirulina major CS-329]|uniref:GtrA family protein n=1 Tax=Spirulina TaxID=1154 RepID=UPI00232C135E|nr:MULTISPECIES: GtrA family protein [Spirulina]MDB9494598.1 GtrA family protein [Spirulina subsalsa CS-330]MDB9504848.1 GtrA family protein [Spirulina major CS-329]
MTSLPIKTRVNQFFAKPMVRWWIVGLFFTGFNFPLLYVLKEVAGFSVAIASLIAAELTTIIRFFLNDRWVFGHAAPTWKRFWQYHATNFGSFVVWWGGVNIFDAIGVHYLLAALFATVTSVGLSMITNFLWIWRKTPSPSDHAAPKSP